jgi:hypothetical protein
MNHKVNPVYKLNLNNRLSATMLNNLRTTCSG